MSWRLAKSLTTLRNQVNTKYPNRSKLSDGTIGDAAHRAVASDHNPNAAGVVTALDLTHHAGYFDAHKLADILITNRHPNLEYVISNKRIAGAWTGWEWQAYSGSNPHDKHIHVSVGDGRPDGQALGNYDSTAPWTIIKEEDEMLTSKNHLIAMWRQFKGVSPSTAEIKSWTDGNNTYAELLDKLHKSRKDLPTVLAQLKDCQASGSAADKEHASWWRDLVSKIKRS